MKTKRRIVAFSLVVMLGVGVAAVAANFGTPPRVIPFRGTLATDGVAVSGAFPMTFFLVTTSTGTFAGNIWSEDHPAVNVTDGQFTVPLGTVSAFADSFFTDNPELYLGMKVSGVELAGLQRFYSAPFALTAAQAKDLAVKGNLSVTGSAQVTGALTTDGTLTANGALTVGGALTADGANAQIRGTRFMRNLTTDADSTTSEIASDTGIYKQLMLLGNRSNADGARHVAVYDDLSVDRDLSVTRNGTVAGSFLVNGIATISASAVNTNYNLYVGGAVGVFSQAGYQGPSDVRLKKDIVPIARPLELVAAMRGVRFHWRADELPERHFSRDPQVGVIAQEVERVLPEIVRTDSNGYKSVDYGKLGPLFIESIKELAARNQELARANRDLSERLDRLERAIARPRSSSL